MKMGREGSKERGGMEGWGWAWREGKERRQRGRLGKIGEGGRLRQGEWEERGGREWGMERCRWTGGEGMRGGWAGGREGGMKG